MRCIACNKLLTQREDSRTFSESGERVGLCDDDALWVDIPMVGGNDLHHDQPAEEGVDSNDVSADEDVAED